MRIPAVSTLLGKGVLPETHELSLGMLGHARHRLREQGDGGLRPRHERRLALDDRIVGSYSDFCKGAVKIHVDIDPAEMDKVVKVDVGIVGDAKTVLGQLCPCSSEVTRRNGSSRSSRWRREYPLAYRKEGKVRAQHVIQELRSLAGDKAVFTTDVGQHQMWAAQFVGTEESRNWITSGGAGTMGYGFPAAIGAQLGRPGELVIAIVGDGGFQMTLSELATMRNLKLPVKMIVINNHYLGMVQAMAEHVLRRPLLGGRPRGKSRFRQAGRGVRRQGLSHNAARRRAAACSRPPSSTTAPASSTRRSRSTTTSSR